MPRLFMVLAGALFVGGQAVTFTAAADNADVLEEMCHERLNLGDSGCACVHDRAEADLNDTQQALVIARLNNDQAAHNELMAELSPEEINEAGRFVTETPGACAGQ